MLVLWIAAGHSQLAAQANGGSSLLGSVVDDSGRAVADARVFISQVPAIKPPIPAPPVLTGALAAMVTTDVTGSFRADGLAPDEYILCAASSTPGLLDPCHWSNSAPTVTLAPGQLAAGLKIVMAKGSIIRVHVDDPQRLLRAVATGVDLDLAVHIVTAKGLHYSAPVLSNTGVAREHAITVPFNTPVSLHVLSPRLIVSDQSGTPFAARGASVNVPAGTTPTVVTLAVTGER